MQNDVFEKQLMPKAVCSLTFSTMIGIW